MTIIVALILISMLIFVHELGHFLAAKATGTAVLEFSVGQGPVLISHRYGETLYSLRILPIGGFASLAGEDEEVATRQSIPRERCFTGKSLPVRAAVLMSGAVANFLFAMVLFAIIFTGIGVPSEQPIVGAVIPDWPAAVAGLQPADRIVSLAGEPISSWPEIDQLINAHVGATLPLQVERNGQILQLQITPKADESGRSYLGVNPVTEKRQVLAAVGMGIKQTISFSQEIISTLVNMLTGTIKAEGSGPLGLIVIIGQVAKTGILNLLALAAIISIQLGIFNLLPIPAMDGGRLLFLLLELVRGRPVDPKKEGMVHLVGYALLLAFMVLVTFHDLQRLNIL